MASEEYSRLQSQIFRYGHNYDQNVDGYCPPLVKTKKGEIAKRQPKVPQRNNQYWKAQCSFRGLKTTGRVEELRDRVRNRDKTRDAAVKLEQDRIKHLLDLQGQKLEAEENERHWQDPQTSLDEKASIDAHRALKEHLEINDGLRQSSITIKAASGELVAAAAQLGLASQIARAPNSMIDRFDIFNASSRWTVVGHPTTVAATAKQLAERAVHDNRQQELAEQREQAKQQAALLAEEEAKKVKQRTLLAEAKQMRDWDITGVWEVHCDTLANYTSEEAADLSLEIYRDDFALDQNGRPYSEDAEDSEDEHNYYDPQPRAPKQSAISRPNMPKFCANFKFSVLEGVMRMWPQHPTGTAFKIKSNPTFNYVWRGRETGEGEIESTADEKIFQITFGNHGTTFEGTFGSTYIGYAEVIKGTKISHGYDQQKSSSEEWRENSERQWNRESTGRWGKW